jgi:hypothetical protein
MRERIGRGIYDCERSEHHSLRVETGDQTSTNDCLKEPGIFDGRCYAFCLRRFSINGSKILVMVGLWLGYGWVRVEGSGIFRTNHVTLFGCQMGGETWVT